MNTANSKKTVEGTVTFWVELEAYRSKLLRTFGKELLTDLESELLGVFTAV